MRLDEREVREQLYNAFKAKVNADFPQDFARFFHRWLVNDRSDPSFLYGAIGLLEDGRPHDALEDAARSIRYGRFEDGLLVEVSGFSQTVPTEPARFVLRLFIDLLQDYLPSGSLSYNQGITAQIRAEATALTSRIDTYLGEMWSLHKLVADYEQADDAYAAQAGKLYDSYTSGWERTADILGGAGGFVTGLGIRVPRRGKRDHRRPAYRPFPHRRGHGPGSGRQL